AFLAAGKLCNSSSVMPARTAWIGTCGCRTENGASMNRCTWAKGDLYHAYHDREWGVPSHDDRHLFEMLILEGAQAGLSWSTILRKRENYRRAFDDFDAEKVARYTESRVQKLLNDPGIVRNR